MYPLQVPPFNLRIDLCRRNIRMAQHNLNSAKIRTAFEQMRGEGMPKHVR